jgi:putative transposase
MRQPRLKAPEDCPMAYYHCVSRVVERRFALGEEERFMFVRLMRLYERVCQVRVVSYCIMSNHFHLLVEVPQRPAQLPSEGELLAHIGRCHGKRRAGLIEEQLRQYRRVGAHQAAQALLDGWLARMWDLSHFMKTLKQRFTQWFNKHHGRRGTLWEDRFRSTIVEGGSGALPMVAAYIDLNPLRAGIVKDPKDYLWSSYGATLGGVKAAVLGLEVVMQHAAKLPPKGRRALELYRMTLFGHADAGDEHSQRLQAEAEAQGSKGSRRGVSHAEVEQVRSRQGQLSRAEMLRHRVRYFTAGAVIGTRAFVDSIFHARRERFGPKRRDGARSMRGADFGGLCALRDLRVAPLARPG